MARAFFVVGPESSGTRIMTRLLLDCGLAGSAGHRQPWDNLRFPEPRQDIAFRRSIPHGGTIPDLEGIVRAMEAAGYTVTVLVMVRELYAMARSQVANGHVTDLVEALANIATAYRLIARLAATAAVPIFYVPLEGLVAHPQAPEYFLRLLGLVPRRRTRLVDPNGKYYGRGDR